MVRRDCRAPMRLPRPGGWLQNHASRANGCRMHEDDGHCHHNESCARQTLAGNGRQSYSVWLSYNTDTRRATQGSWSTSSGGDSRSPRPILTRTREAESENQHREQRFSPHCRSHDAAWPACRSSSALMSALEVDLGRSMGGRRDLGGKGEREREKQETGWFLLPSEVYCGLASF